MANQNYNITQLQTFIETFGLRNKQTGQILFDAKFRIKTEHIDEIFHEQVSITIEYPHEGQVYLYGDLKEGTHIMECLSLWQDFKFVNNEYLLISGKHNKYPETIGKYLVEIYTE